MSQILKLKTKKIIVAVFLVSFLIGTTPVANAGYWSENFAANLMKQALEEFKKAFDAMILKSLQQAANQTIRNQVRKLVAGTADAAIAVANYEDFIFGSADRNANLFVSDFFRGVLEGASRETRQEMRMVERALLNQLEPSIPAIDFQSEFNIDSETPREDIFNQTLGGGIDQYLNFQMSGEHPFDVYVNTKAALIEKMRREQEAKNAEVVAGAGFASPTNGDGSVVPGSVMQAVMAKAETADMDAITSATNWQQVVASVATKSVTTLVRQGVKVVSKPINNKVRELQRSVDRGTDNLLDQLYGERR